MLIQKCMKKVRSKATLPTNPNVLVEREKWIGGSDMPTIMQFEGATKYGHTWEKLVLSKLGLSEDKFTGNKHTVFGSLIEKEIRDYINKKYDMHCIEDTAYDTERFYRANCDGYNGQLLLEIKTYSSYKDFDWEYYLAQCQFYCEVFDCEDIWLIAYKKPTNFCIKESDDEYVFDFELIPENITVYKIKRDREYFKIMEAQIKLFKKYFKKRKRELLKKDV